MKRFIEKNLQEILIAAELILLLFVAVISIIDGENKISFLKITSAIASAGIVYIPFRLGILAHSKQNVRLNQIENIVSQSNTKILAKAKWITRNFNPYVHIALYAMYQAYYNRPFDYRIIDPGEETTMIYKVIILSLTTAFKSDSLFGYIADDYLFVEVFDNDVIKAVTNGNDLISMYASSDSVLMVKRCVERIDAACGITQN